MANLKVTNVIYRIFLFTLMVFFMRTKTSAINVTAGADMGSGSKLPQIVFSKVQKTGSSTLDHIFARYREQPHGPGATPMHIYGKTVKLRSEGPQDAQVIGKLKQMNQGELTFIWVVPLREPVERVVSHFYQDRPCIHGGGGGFHKECRRLAQHGYMQWLDKCVHANNLQSKYFPDREVLRYTDQLILNDRFAESIVLLHLQFPSVLPLELLTAGRYKSRVHTTNLWRTVNTIKWDEKSPTRESVPSCTDEWLAFEGIANLDEKFATCKVSCAGRAGYELRSTKERDETIKRNQQDAELWRFANEIWMESKSATLRAANVSLDEFRILVKEFQSN